MLRRLASATDMGGWSPSRSAPQWHSSNPLLRQRNGSPHFRQVESRDCVWMGHPAISLKSQCPSMKPFSATHQGQNFGFFRFKSAKTSECPSKRQGRGLPGEQYAMASNSDERRLAILANFVTLTP